MAAINPYPLLWPEPQPRTDKARRIPSLFKVDERQAARDLRKELELLGATEVVITTNVKIDIEGTKSLWRNDPGVAVWFLWGKLQRCFACDQYLDVRSNLRAIGLSIEGLRTMERHATQLLNMLMTATNAAALPGKTPWRQVLGVGENATLEDANAKYRELAKTRHPDAPTGSHEKFLELGQAMEEAQKELSA